MWGARGGVLTNRQTEKAGKPNKQTNNHFNQRGTGAVSRGERNIHQLVLVVLVAKGGNLISRGLFSFCCCCFFLIAGNERVLMELKRGLKHGERA